MFVPEGYITNFAESLLILALDPRFITRIPNAIALCSG
jgi:hypothetical protein